MPLRLGDRIAMSAGAELIGREAELAALTRVFDDDGPPVTFVHGIGGIGKSSLMAAFAQRARASGATVVLLDGRAVEPTEQGVLAELRAAIGGRFETPEAAGERLAALPGRVVLIIDTYELLRLVDTWLRQVFLPALPDNVRLVVAGREAPVSAWYLAPGWGSLVQRIHLDALEETQAIALLGRYDISGKDALQLNRSALGHPLALKLAVLSFGRLSSGRYPPVSPVQAVAQEVIDELSRLYLQDVTEPLTRRALEAASVVRRTTISLLEAMLPDVAPFDACQRLQSLPFVEPAPDGLHLHDSVQHAIAGALRSSDPATYRRLRRAAASQLQKEVRNAGRADLWRYTADLLFLLENPIIRDAFFPIGAHAYAVEPALLADASAIATIITRHEPPTEAALLLSWWEQAPEVFRVIRDGERRVLGFYTLFDPSTISAPILTHDPITAAWLEDLRGENLRPNDRALFCRRWLSLGLGDHPSPEQAACWLDLKRTYMEVRPDLRRIYCVATSLEDYGAVLTSLQFQLVPGAQRTFDGVDFHSAVLDFGPGSVDGWLAAHLERELGLAGHTPILDEDARQLVLDGTRQDLTPLEFGVMRTLVANEGRVVSRSALLSEVWGYDYDGGSNVVDVVVRLLRKKLGASSSAIETVRGTGYRYCPAPR